MVGADEARKGIAMQLVVDFWRNSAFIRDGFQLGSFAHEALILMNVDETF